MNVRRYPFLGLTLLAAVSLMVSTPWDALTAAQSEIDTFMERVLQRRDENRTALHDYVLDERETFELTGPGRTPLQGFSREFTWYVQDGYLVRSPVRFDGVAIGETERREYESDWLRQERRRGIGRQRQRQGWGGRSAYDDVRRTVEQSWGKSISRDLARAIAEDAQLWSDGVAAIVAGTDRILADLGGVTEVGFGRVVEQARAGFVMLDSDRLARAEVARMLTAVIPQLTSGVTAATAHEFDGLIELLELAVSFELPLPDVVPSLEQAHAALVATGMADRARVLDNTRQSVAAVGPPSRAGDSVVTVDAGPASTDAVQAGLQPRFVSEAYFLDFQFEPGNYYFAGREDLAGREVVRIEYYPERLFSDEDDQSPGSDRDESIEAGFDKTSLVTLWIDPEEYQIVKFTFDNVGLDFLPLRWLVRLDDLKASMVMGQPIEGVWLPEKVELTGKVTMASGSFDVTYSRAFSEYRRADVRVRIRSYGPPQD